MGPRWPCSLTQTYSWIIPVQIGPMFDDDGDLEFSAK